MVADLVALADRDHAEDAVEDALDADQLPDQGAVALLEDVQGSDDTREHHRVQREQRHLGHGSNLVEGVRPEAQLRAVHTRRCGNSTAPASPPSVTVARVSSPVELDGRTARRHRNTDAVLDAVHQLFVEGHRLPTVEDVALKSGVSLRSIYRYFPDRDELLQAALVRRMEVAEPFFRLDDLGSGPLGERIERFVDHRIELHDTMAPTARAALQAAATAPLIAEVVRQRRTQLTDQTRRHFAPELEALPAGRRRRPAGRRGRALPVRGPRVAARGAWPLTRAHPARCSSRRCARCSAPRLARPVARRAAPPSRGLRMF